MGNNNFKYIFIAIFFIYAKSYSQDLKDSSFIQLRGFEYEEIIKDGVTKKMTGNFSIISKTEKGKIKWVEIKRYNKGKKVGEWITYHNLFAGLKLSFIANYKNDVLDGYYMNTDNHTFSKEGYYKKGKKNGIWKENESSEFKIVSYKNGIKSGSFKSTDNDLNIEVSGQYKKGKKNGIWITKYTDTDMIIKEEYKNGELISEK